MSAFDEPVYLHQVRARDGDGAIHSWNDVTPAAAAMEQAADDMLDGLVNTSGSEKRLGALDDYNIAAATFTQALDAAKDAASEI